ncbi:L7a [Perkinsela sp. CCAP 1560/4]|nr:L7a [Perkinsela sp. CCAP 1560/4]|eukprot:KNH07941.1 L7a [Perkinsela sp. CCAP 1560/4]
MVKKTAIANKKVAAKTKSETSVSKKKAAKKNSIFVDSPKRLGLGGNVLPKRDVTRQVRWPVYVKRQREKRVLERRMKVPPAVHQFRNVIDKDTKKALLTFLAKYAVTAADKKAKEEGKLDKAALRKQKQNELVFGIQEVTKAVETRKASMVAIAHDVDPLELVLWLPQLCIAHDIPYCIVKSKSELGQLVGVKTCTAVALKNIRNADQSVFEKLQASVKTKFNDRFEEIRRSWGGNQQGIRAQIRAEKRKKSSAQGSVAVEA